MGRKEKGRGGVLSLRSAYLCIPFLPCIALSILLCFSSLPAAQGPELGKIIEKVVCFDDQSQSYALYLPPNFDPGKKWPILFLFDPGGRGPVALEAFRDGAERCGWILAGSNNSRNGPLEPCLKAARLMRTDSQKRLPLDEQRIYAGGFSGGARVASVFRRAIDHEVAGLIGCGAGLNTALKPEDIKPAFHFGLVGLADFNYGEMKALDAAFEGVGVPHRLLVYEGAHDWPDPSLCARAVAWLDIVAMKENKKAKDDSEIGKVSTLEIEEAKALEEQGRIYWAAARYEALISLLDGLRETAPLEDTVKALKSRKEYGRFLKEEKARDRRALEIQSGFLQAFAVIQRSTNGLQELPDILRDLNLGFLKQDARKARAVEDRGFASRLLFDLAFKAEATGSEYFEKNETATAAALFELALEACEEGNRWEKYIRFDLACVWARNGDAKKALRHLAAAVDKGFADVQAMETVKALDRIRETPEYREILSRIKK